jgi:mycothiol system anti-sigma-R factor
VIADILIAAAGILLANEACELSPWCARKLVHWSACRRYTDPARAEARAEELAALINERPGNILKLVTASCFASGAVVTVSRRAFAHETPAMAPSLPPAHHSPGHLCSEVLARVYSYLDGDIEDESLAQIQQHIDECGPCLREYGLEKAVKRLVQKCCGTEPSPSGLRSMVGVRIRTIQAELEVAEFRDGAGNPPTLEP